jgi:hypothetical protein
VTWDHGFGDGRAGSQVTLGGAKLKVVNWATDGGSVRVVVPKNIGGELLVTRGDNGLITTVGLNLRAARATAPVVEVLPPKAGCVGTGCAVIQPAIDAAPNGAIILLRPGVYQENVILWKPVTLQGSGAAVTQIDGVAALGNLPLKQQAENRILALIADGSISIVPGQASDFTLEMGAGILVAGCDYTTPGGCPNGNSFQGREVAIDGLAITGASEAGGGILLNGFTDQVRITNDEIVANEGSIGGGIRLGEPTVVDNFNPGAVIAHNRIAQNGSRFSGGGGIAVYAGAHGYRITDNLICGNFSNQYGGGVGHFGLSRGGLIEHNSIVSNESFDEGGGIHVGGENAAGATGLTAGSGSVVIDRNLIQGNKAGDDGGGIRTRRVNGADVAASPGDPAPWFQIDIFNNIIVNNSSADHGGGLSFDDTVKLDVVANTVARNDSTGTGSGAFGGPCTENSPIGQRCPSAEAIGGLVTSVPQVAGIAGFAYSTPLAAALAPYCAAEPADPLCAGFSNPTLTDNIVWQNRSFFWDATANANLGGLVLASAASTTGPALPGGYWDFAVYGVTGTPGPTLRPTYSLLTNGIGATVDLATDLVGVDPVFVGRCPAPYSPSQPADLVGSCFNVYQATSKGAALGNFVTAVFTPNGIQGDYHLRAVSPNMSPAIGRGSDLGPALEAIDIDGDARKAPTDVGADQTQAPPSALRIAPAGVNFGVVRSSSSRSRPVTVINSSASPVSFALSTGGPFQASGPTSVGPHGTATIIVTFQPAGATGLLFGRLTVAGPGAPATATLQGTAN